MTTQHVEVGDRCRIAVRFDGPGGAPVLVLSSSLGTDMTMWDPQMAAFTERFRVLRYDKRGHGSSDAPEGPYTIERLGRDVVELLDALRLERVAFCGLSLGGMIGQWLAANAASRIERLVLANTAPSIGPASIWNDRIARVRAGGMAAIADSVVRLWFTARFRAEKPETVAAIRTKLSETPPDGYVACCEAIRELDLHEMASRNTTPTRIIAGRFDESTPVSRAADLAAAMPRTPDVVVLEAAHLSNVECADEFNRSVLEFLT